MDESLPYRVAYSIGGEQCQKCRQEIGFGCLRIAIMVQSNEDDCRYPTWYHQHCFFKIRLPSTEAAFDGFAQLRYEHQAAIKKDLGIQHGNESDATTTNRAVVPDFAIEYTKTDQNTCKGCTQQIQVAELRIMRFVPDGSANQNDVLKTGQAHWYHVACFVRLRSEIGWLRSGDFLPGFKRLTPNDKNMIENQIPAIKYDVRPIENTNDEDAMKLDVKIRSQNDEYFEIYDYIVNNVRREDQIRILDANGQLPLLLLQDMDAQILHHLADVICFGALQVCNSCKNGKLIFCNWIYKCTHGSGWTSCGKEFKEPPRYCARIPPELFAKYSFLTQHSGSRTRVLHSFKLFDEHGNDLVHGPYKKPVLFNMEFVLVGSFTKPRGDLERQIRKLGGKVGIEVHDRVAAIISTSAERRKMGNQMIEACKHNIQVVSEEFLNEIQTSDADPILYIISKSICDWGGDPYERIEENDVPTQRDTDFYTKSMPEKVTYKWKDGGAVDPECGLEENAHVYSSMINKRKVFYSVILGLVDIERDKNSYFRMQLLKSDDQNLFWVFESWGRIGTVAGSKQLKVYGKLHEAVNRFYAVYKDKTANNFGNKVFQKRPYKFHHLDVEIGVPKKVLDNCDATKLDAPVFDLMQMLFDVSKMENMMCKCDLDLKQMPLGKISAKQIKTAMTTLRSIGRLIQRNGSMHEIRDASNKFYTLIPHTFGVDRVPIIDSIKTVNAKNEMLETLLNMEIIYSFLERENGEEKTNPLDACYHKLNATIVPIAKDSNEFQQFCYIVHNTHGPTHINYTLEVLEIFKVVRNGEDEQFQKQLTNHQLLWHGSRQMNFASILSNGLKIAPPEATATGYMFGKGIYFADVVSKSANYCFTDKNNNTGLMLLCEVALGNSREMSHAFNIEDIPNTLYQSAKGVGNFFPSQYQCIDGIVAPFYGISTSSTNQSALQYNEFIVYNANQVKIKYLFKMKFHFKY